MKKSFPPCISVIVPTYNGNRFLTATLQSLLCQDALLELLLINDASNESPEPILKEINDPRIKSYHHRKQKGIAASRNTGLRHACGKYIMFFDHDDIMLPGALAGLLSAFRQSPSAKIVFGYLHSIIDARGIKTHTSPFEYILKGQRELAGFCRKIKGVDNIADLGHYALLISLTNCLFTRNLTRIVGLFNTSYDFADDADYLWRVNNIAPLFFADVLVRKYRYHGQNYSYLNAKTTGPADLTLLAQNHPSSFLALGRNSSGRKTR